MLQILLTQCMPFQDGTLLLDGKTPEELGVPQWRTQVTYVPQSRTQQKGTPSELYYQAQVVLASSACPHPQLLYCSSESATSRPEPLATLFGSCVTQQDRTVMPACARAAIQGAEGQATR